MWVLRVNNPEQNHDPIDTSAAHPMHSWMTKETMQHVIVKMNSNIMPRQVIASLWEGGADCALNHDVYNAWKQIRLVDMGVSTSIEALLDRLKVSRYLHRADFGEERRLSRFVVPVLDTDKAQELCNDIAAMFPGTAQIMCTWHINKNLSVKCKSQLATGEKWDEFPACWARLLASAEDTLYQRNLQDLRLNL
ncbi:hypothetical protein PsorP6_009197 [Peronosclerospora sorghi]|uniref:Uncharacterized protein n=1 Tax=Peronosclerospora sorghi TaxID=230839 RepID=A0ACC0W094_9STRA|nr:hypothetical protein PsorP6_009197 [Peronosclerospora sorghi]